VYDQRARLQKCRLWRFFATRTAMLGKWQPNSDYGNDQPPQSFGALLRGHRQAAGLTQVELAERAGLSTRGIADLERGARRAPHSDTVRRLADALQLVDHQQATLRAAARRAIVLVSAPEFALVTGPARPRVPTPLTSFVGRELELDEVRGLLRTTRLLTLAGTGGIGKTRLALEVARSVEYDRTEVAFVDLASLVDPSLVGAAVATVLRILDQPGRDQLEVLVHVIGERPTLLVLDNCEHVITTCAEVSEKLLLGCPQLRILATSREPLGVNGETTWRVPSLDLPDPSSVASLKVISRSQAIQLFIERAGAIQPPFVLTDQNAAAVVEVCRRLDGVPLAIELAAARVRVLSVQEIAARLEDRFQLLIGATRTAPGRQQTLRAALDWSYVLLRRPEQLLFDRLSVFAGSFSLDVVEEVCAVDEVTRPAVLDLLTSLIDKSLVLAQPGVTASTRYRLLETMRAFGNEHLAAGGSTEVFRSRHAAFFLAWAEQAGPEIERPLSGAGCNWLEREDDNLRVALQWFLDQRLAEESHRLGAALWSSWGFHGHTSEGRAWLAKILALPGADRAEARVAVLNGAGFLAWQQNDTARAQLLHEEALVVAQARGDQLGAAQALQRLADTARVRGDYVSARTLFQAAFDAAHAAGSLRLQAHCVGALGMVADAEGDFVAARSLGEKALALFSEVGSSRYVTTSLTNLGRAEHRLGNRAAARSLLEKALVRARGANDPTAIAAAVLALGELALDENKLSQARTLLAESLALYVEGGDALRSVRCLLVFAQLAAAQNRFEHAFRLAGATHGLRTSMGVSLIPREQAQFHRWSAPARAVLGAELADSAWTAGLKLSLEQGVAQALEDA
jgi:predicted ATPase/DNA-binding XRE family transcriptional regulator